MAKEKRCARGTRVRSCTKKIHLAEIQLQRDPSNEEVSGLLSEAQGQLAEEFQDSVARNRHLSSASWLRYGDTCSKTFFDFHRIGKKKALMRELETVSWTVSGQHDLAHYVTSFYTRLYTSDADSLDTSAAQDDALPSHGGETQVRVSQSQVTELGIGSTLPASNSRKGYRVELGAPGLD
jgi:hypothetical protein